MDVGKKKTTFLSRLKLLATTRISAIAPTIRVVAEAIVSAAGVIGIVAFSLAPFLPIYPAYAVWPESAENATDVYHYQKLEFDLLCGRNTTSNEMITIRCKAEEAAGNTGLPSALNCGGHSALMTNLLLLQDGGTCVVANAELTNETRVVPTQLDVQKGKNEIVILIIVAYLGPVLVGLVVLHISQSFKLVRVFLVYRREHTSSPLMSPQALRCHFLKPEWLRYFRRSLLISCSTVLYHGLYAVLIQYVRLPMFVWVLGTFVGPFCMMCFNCQMVDRAHFVLSLPYSLFENGVISRDEIERLWQEKLANM